MKTKIFIAALSLGTLCTSISMAQSKEDTHKQHEKQEMIYACPMHPEVTSNEQGKCSKCGMNLEKTTVTGSKKEEGKAVYTCCPGCPDVKSDKPGKCPKCGMELKKQVEQEESQYVCPMHPNLSGNKTDKCSKCGMSLEKKKTTEGHKH